MHTKQKGNIAESAVLLELSKLGYCVFREIGDLSKVDLVAEKDGKLISFQVKGVTPVNGTIPLHLKKAGPNYRFTYKRGMFDYFAVVNLDNYEVAFVPACVLDNHKSLFVLRLEKSKNNQAGNHFSDYTKLDCSSETIRATRNWDDIVQTTNESASEN